MRITKVIAVTVAVLVALLIVGIVALWIYVCLNPGVIYCRDGGVYMSRQQIMPFAMPKRPVS